MTSYRAYRWHCPIHAVVFVSINDDEVHTLCPLRTLNQGEVCNRELKLQIIPIEAPTFAGWTRPPDLTEQLIVELSRILRDAPDIRLASLMCFLHIDEWNLYDEQSLEALRGFHYP